MRFIVDASPNGDRIAVEIGANVDLTNASHNQIVDAEKVGEAVGTVVQRILDRRPHIVVVPEGKRMVSVGISWLAFSIVEVAVPIEVVDDEALREAIRSTIKADGLPEVVINPSMEFIEAMNAYAPPGEDGKFVCDLEREIDIG